MYDINKEINEMIINKYNYTTTHENIKQMIDDLIITEEHVYTTDFDIVNQNNISIYNYIYRILKYFECPMYYLIISIIYIKKITEKGKIKITKKNIHLIILTSFIITVKYWDDDIYSMGHYAKIGGIDVKRMVKLEIAFLKLIDWKLYI